MNFINAITAWVQHAFCDPEHPEDYFANSVTAVDEVNFMNEGYPLCHHHRASLHWTEMPAHFERLRDRMREAGSLVFRDLDFMGLFVELTLFRRMDVLAEKLVPWEPMNHEQRLALLAKRTSLRTPYRARAFSSARKARRRAGVRLRLFRGARKWRRLPQNAPAQKRLPAQHPPPRRSTRGCL